MTHPQLRVRCPVLMSHADSRFLAMFFPLSTLLVPSSHINFTGHLNGAAMYPS